ncbi:hypothetical protein [Solimicrobium silvestre]|nr:hypothetical protein [Solimicrobium silvestre]
MNRYFFSLMLCILLSLVLGCSKPDQVKTIKSPTDGIFYTVEIYHEHSPVADGTRVYANLERHGKVERMLVLEGGDLTITDINWNGPYDATLCLNGGITDTFRNEVTLISGDTAVTIHNYLHENCNIQKK